MKAVGYIRVSTEDQAKEGVSLDIQQAKIEDYASLKDMNLVEIVQDAGISAKNLKREGMQRILAMTKSKQIDAVVVLKLDRMFRSSIDALQTTKLFNKHGIAFHSIQETIDTASAMGRFFFTLLSGIAELERNTIGERTKLALAHKKANGEKTGGYVPFGYSLDPKSTICTMKLIPNEAEQRAITVMQNYREQGLSLQAICDNLERYGIRTKRGKDVWLPNTVSRILKAKSFNTS